MTLLGNIFWFVLGGWALFFIYALSALVFFPAMIPLFRLAIYSAWPFGRAIVTQDQLTKYRELGGIKDPTTTTQATMRRISGVMNILWLFTFGWMIALAHLGASIANLFFFWLIVTIPNIAGNWKLIPVAFMPFNKVIVPNALEKEIRLALSKSKLGV